MFAITVMKINAQALKDAKVDIAYRDYCAHLLVPLNKCRTDTLYMPWKCSHERHEYEKCEYYE
jgi:NADH dehydrogenase (ubiquinone) 1 beta subcomplex subunit 7